MTDIYNLGLFLSVEKEKERAIQYLNNTTLNKYKELLFSLIECVYDIQFNKLLKKEHLEILEQGMRQPLELIFDYYSGKFVTKLSYNFEEAKNLLVKLVDDKSSKIRLNAVTLILCNPPSDIKEYVITKSINDESRKVREKVADVCERLNYTQMVDLLEKQYGIENDDTVRKGLYFSINLLRYGYLLEEKENGVYNLIIKTNKGLHGTLIKKEKIELYLIDDIVKSYREKGKLPWD